MLRDLRIGLRLLWKDRAFTLASSATLAICMGANVALFSIVDHVLLRPLPFPDADRILLMANQYPRAGIGINSTSGVPDYYDRLREADVFEAQALYRWANVSINRGSSPERLLVMDVTPSFFHVLGSTAALGRTFTEAEGEAGNERRVVLSHALWQSAFGGDAQAIGQDLLLDGRPYTIAGVMPPTFSFLDGETEVRLWRPLAFTAEQRGDDRRHSNGWQNIGKLKPGATIDVARQQIDALNARNLERFPQYKELLLNAGFHTTVVRLQDNLVRDVRPALYLLWGGALFVLLIGAANVANLVLVRTAARAREVGIRIALGASRFQIARAHVTESLLLTMVSAIGGLLIGHAALRLLAALNMLAVPRAREIRIDAVVGLETLALAAGVGVVLGLIPVAHLTGINPAAVLTEQSRSSAGGRRSRLVRRAFVVAQVAFAFVLLVGAGLLLASFQRILEVDPGFESDRVLTAEVDLPGLRYEDDAAIVTFAGDALLRLGAIPGVTDVGLTDTIPFGGNNSDSVILAEGYEMQPGESLISPARVVVSPGYFEAMRASLVRGRFFDSRDSATAPKTIIVDETLAMRFWPGRDPVGRRMYQPTDINNLLAITDETVFLTVVGVVRDLELQSLDEQDGSVGTYFYPFDQQPERSLAFALRTAGDPAAVAGPVRAVINGLDSELPVYDVQTMTDRLARSLARRRAPMLVATAFGVVALLLSAVGVYGVLAYLVAQRTKEIGIRMALGCSAPGVFQLVLREGLLLVGIGLAIGGAGVLALQRSLDSLLFGIDAADPGVLIAVTALLALIALGASTVPARRATRIDLVAALAE
jgi:predicted permease